MYFLEFYKGKQPGVGDRSVVILDGRESRYQWRMHGEDWARKHGFDGYRICKGKTFNRGVYVLESHLESV